MKVENKGQSNIFENPFLSAKEITKILQKEKWKKLQNKQLKIWSIIITDIYPDKVIERKKKKNNKIELKKLQRFYERKLRKLRGLKIEK